MQEFIQKTILFIIPTFNRKNDVLNILEDIKRQKTIHKINITLVIDGSTDGTEQAVIKKYPDINIINGEGEWWYTKTMNQGFQYAIKTKPDFIITMNDDCRIKEDYVHSLLGAYNMINGERKIVGSMSFSIEEPQRIIFSGVKDIVWWRYKVKYYIKKNTKITQKYSGIYKSISLPGRGILIPYEIIRDIGIFDERFIQYYSDSEFIFRARKNGIGTYISWDSIVYTYLSKTGKGSIYAKESFFLFLKNFFNTHSRNNIFNIIRIINMYGIIWLLPLTITIKILGHIKNYLKGSE
jgi:GT2 family glycosyltransferase